MKIIDLYNLIVKKEFEKLPKKVKWRSIIYNLSIDEDFINYEPQDKNGDWLLNQFLWKLNEEVEILEEQKKIPEKINISNFPRHNNSLKKTAIKLNEIIDYLESKGDE